MAKKDNKYLSADEKIKRVTEELREKNKKVIEQRRREGFGIPDGERTDAQRKIQAKKQKEKWGHEAGAAEESMFWRFMDKLNDNLDKFNANSNPRPENLCPNCKYKVSPAAYTCPSCGHPLRYRGTRAGAGCLGWAIIFVAIPIFILIFFLSR